MNGGNLIENHRSIFDVRALVNGFTALALAGFSIKTALGAAKASA